MTNKTYKNLSTLSAQLFLGTALVAGTSNHAVAVHSVNAGDETNYNTAVNAINNGSSDLTLDFTANVVTANSLTAFGTTLKNITFNTTAGNNRTLNLNAANHTGIAGTINLIKSGGADLILAGHASAIAHSYNGSTKIEAGRIQLGANAAGLLPSTTDLTIVGSSSSGLTMGANSQTLNSVLINGTDSTASITTSTGNLTVTTDLTITKGLINATGAANISVASGTLTLTDGSITTTGGTITAKNISTAASKTITATGGTLSVSNGTIAGVYAGTGALTKAHDATTANKLTLSGANTFSGGVTINGGTLVASNASALGTAAGGVAFSNDAEAKTLQIDTADHNAETGAFGLNGTGKITINAVKNIAFTGTMTHGTSTEFTKTGEGKLSIGNTTNLTLGVIDVTAYTGTAKVEAGTLEVNAGATISGLTSQIGEDATLAGSTAAAGIGAVTNAGKVKPGVETMGASAVTLTVSTLDMTKDVSSIEILASQSAASTTGISNKLVVTGALTETKQGTYDFHLASATIDATAGLDLVDVIQVGSVTGQTIATAADLDNFLKGKRARVISEKHLLSDVTLKSGSSFAAGALKISANIKDLSNDLGSRFDDKELADSFLKGYIVAGLNDSNNVTEYNSKVAAITSNTGTGFTSNATASGRLKLAVADLMLLSKTNKALASKYLSQISGASNRSAMESSASAMNAVSGAVSSHVASALGGASPYTAPVAFNAGFRNTDGALAKIATDSGLSSGCALDESLDNGAWVKGFGGWENLSNNGASHPGNRTTVAGAAFGFDHFFTRDLLAGISLGYARINTTVNDGLGDSKADSYSATIYGGARFDDLTVDGAVMLTSNHFDMKRTVPTQNAGIQTTAASHAKASPKSLDVGVHLGAGYLIKTQSVDVTPFASVDYRNASFDAYTETGLGSVYNAFLLQVAKARLQTWTPKVGVALSKAMVMAGGNWTPTLTLGWKAFMPMGSNSVNTKIVGFLNSFESKHVVKTRHMGFAGLGVELDMRSGWHVNFGYEGAYNSKLNTHEFMVKVGKRF